MPSDFLDIAYLQLSFAIKLDDYLNRYPISLSDFNTELSISNPSDPSDCVRLPNNQFPTYGDLQRAAENNILICIGVLAITLWESVEKKYKYITERKKKSLDTYEEKLAGLIYMLRCCYAHNMAEPRWNVTNDKYKIVYQVGGNSIDLRHMNSEIFTQDSIGGDITLWLLRKECKSRKMI